LKRTDSEDAEELLRELMEWGQKEAGEQRKFASPECRPRTVDVEDDAELLRELELLESEESATNGFFFT